MANIQRVSSKNLNGSSELTLIADIKSGFVQLTDPMTYTTRLQKLLATLFESRKGNVEEGISFVGPLERLRTIHFVRWAVIDEGRRLLLAVSFDRPWEPYIRRIANDAGPILDVIFSHCEGYDEQTTRHGYDKFAEWVHARQKNCDFFFSIFPGQSVDDIRYLRKLKQELEMFVARGAEPAVSRHTAAALLLDAQVSEQPVPRPGPYEYVDFFRIAIGLYRLRSFFPSNQVLDPAYTDRATFDRACASILGTFGGPGLTFPAFPPSLAAQYYGLTDWYDELAERAPPALAPPGKPALGVQGGILEAYEEGGKAMTHGAVVLLQLGQDPKLLELLASHSTQKSGIRYNLGFTWQGLSKLGLPAQTLSSFPVEFAEGMAARAGLLGDVGSNHPERWRLPKMNVDKESNREVQLSMVDAVVILQARIAGAGDPQDHLWSSKHPLADAVKMLDTCGCKLLHVQPLRRYDSQRDPTTGKYREHFGFLDGFSQPDVRDVASPKAEGKNQVARGEILLGHPNDNGESPGATNPLFDNGSFLVLRKLAQDVAGFNQLATRAACPFGSKLVGRSSEGVPAVDDRLDPSTDFDYAGDPGGRKCPLQSHARLANPRLAERSSLHGKRERTPRILRRGFSYGPLFDTDPSAERGVMFMAYNASLAQQYEVIQRWLNGANSTGLDGSQRDPLTGAVDLEGGRRFRYREGNDAVTVSLPEQPLAKLEWGLYLFVPSQEGLRVMREHWQKQVEIQTAKQAGARVLTLDEQRILGRGQMLLAQLMQGGEPSDWRQLLEGQGSRKESFAVLSAVRANHRVLRTPIGVLVTGEKEALEVLTREELFSVREYWRRMNETGMEMSLGMDAKPVRQAVCPMRGTPAVRADQDYVAHIGQGIDYAREALANPIIHEISRLEAFTLALGTAREALQTSIHAAVAAGQHIRDLLKLPHSTPLPPSFRIPVDLFLFAEKVVSALSESWFAWPDNELMRHGGQPRAPDDPMSYCPADFTVFSQYVFRPQPDEWTARLAAARGARVSAATAKFVAQQRQADGSFAHGFLEKLRQAAEASLDQPEQAESLLVRSLVGTVDGFVAAAFGSFLSVIGQWLESEELWRIQKDHAFAPALLAQLAQLAQAGAAANEGGVSEEPPGPLSNHSPFVARVIETLMLFPKPPWLHRVALEDSDLGNVRISKGERVSVHLGQAGLDRRNPALLFGGRYDAARKALTGPERTPLHACPAQEMAMGVLLGMLVSILDLKNLRMDSTLAISFEVPTAELVRMQGVTTPDAARNYRSELP